MVDRVNFTSSTYMLKGTHPIFYAVFQLEKTEWEKLINGLIKQGVLRSPKVIKAMRAVPRVKFLPSDMRSYSTADTPLPIGFGQTISAPHSFSFALD
jgi:protein-L-isoaspartate O-methyltransferase